MDWQEEPATQQQLLRLQGYGFVPAFPLTVTQAARLIRQYSKHPGHAAALAAAGAAPASAAVAPVPAPPAPVPRPAVPEAIAPLEFRVERLSGTARLHAHRLRLAVDEAHRNLSQNPDRPGVRADAHSAIAARQQFWFDTCRENKEAHGAIAETLEFYLLFGVHYFPPTWGEVGEVLDALDQAMAGWDKDHPELFYETLNLNFPSLLRHK